MLAIAIIAVSPTADAKTKKKVKSSSSASWNGDVPSASLLLKIGSGSSDVINQLKQHGYKITSENKGEYDYNITWLKSGVCKISFCEGIEAADTGYEIEVYDSAKCTKLYNDLKREFKSEKYWHVDRKGNKIEIYYLN